MTCLIAYDAGLEETKVNSLGEKLRVVVADDVPASLRAVIEILGGSCQIVATAFDGPTAAEVIHHFRPAVAVLDVSMPGMSGIEVARRIAGTDPEVGIVMCSVHCDSTLLQAAANAGALAYVEKASLWRDLVPAVMAAARGERLLPPPE